MTVSTLRPDSTVVNTAALTGGATAHAVLSDNSDASYFVTASLDVTTVGFGPLTLPPGARIKTGRLRLRTRGAGTSGVIRSTLNIPAPLVQQSTITWVTETTHTVITRTIYGFEDADADDATLTIEHVSKQVRIVEAYLDITYVALPVVTVSEPTGTVTDATSPLIDWSAALDSDGGVQVAWEARVFTDAQYLAGGFNPETSTATDESGLVETSDTEWRGTVALLDDTYRAYVRVAQDIEGVGRHWSNWAFSGFTINIDRPAAPDLTVTEESDSGRIRIDLDDNAGDATTDWFEVQRTTDGETWLPVRSQSADDGTTVTSPVYDYEAPNGLESTYRARAVHSFGTDGESMSGWVQDTATFDAPGVWWVKHPTLPTLNLALPGGSAGAMFSYPDVNHAVRRGVFPILGAEHPVVVSDRRMAATGTIGIQLRSADERRALNALLDTTDVLLLQGPALAGHDDRYVSFGDQASVRVRDHAWSLDTRDTLPWNEVAKPPGQQTGSQYAVEPSGGLLDGSTVLDADTVLAEKGIA